MKNKSLPKAKQTNEEWFEKLPLDKHMFIAQQEKKKIDKIQKDTEDILDSCYIGAMIEVNEMELDNCIKIAEKANANMRITEQFLYKEGESYYMKVNNEELRTQIRKEAKEMLKSNPKESTLNISRELEKEYKMPVKDLHIIVAEARKELKKEKETNGNINFLKAEEVNEKLSLSIEQAEKKINGLKIKSMEIEGTDGRIYLKSQEGVKIGDRVYKNEKEVQEQKDYSEEITRQAKESINKRMEELKNELQKVSNDWEKELAMYEEIKAVFAM